MNKISEIEVNDFLIQYTKDWIRDCKLEQFEYTDEFEPNNWLGLTLDIGLFAEYDYLRITIFNNNISKPYIGYYKKELSFGYTGDSSIYVLIIDLISNTYPQYIDKLSRLI